MNDKKTSLDFELTRLENLKNDINESTKKLNKFFKEFKKK